MLHVRNHTTTPPGGWWFKTDTGIQLPPPGQGIPGTYAYADLEAMVVAWYKANGRHVPPDISAQIEHQMCARLPPEFCADSSGRLLALHPWSGLRQTISQIVEGTTALLSWLASGFEFVPQAEADARAAVCASCPFNGPAVGCTGCVGSAMQTLRVSLRQLVGARKTAVDGRLNSCYICGCELRVKVWVPRAILASHMSGDQAKAFPAGDAPGMPPGFAGCWLRSAPHDDAPPPLADTPPTGSSTTKALP